MNAWEYKFIKKIKIGIIKIILNFLSKILLSKSKIKGNSMNKGNLINKKRFNK